MRQPINTIASAVVGCLVFFAASRCAAQGYGSPLSMQGLDRTTLHSAASRGAGGVTLGAKDDPSVMFANPSLLQALTSMRVVAGGTGNFTYAKQEQLYGGLQNHSAFSLLTAGVTGWINDPDTLLNPPFTASDTVQRPFDALGPSWSRHRDQGYPIQGFIAVPFDVEGMHFVAGAGVVEYANLNWFYQNNNAFSPSVLSVLNGTIPTGTLNANPYLTQWYQFIQERSGSIRGYGAALSGMPMENLSVGVSAMLLKGSTEEFETRVGRGRMAFYQTYLRLSKEQMVSWAMTGSSDFSGTEYTIGVRYAGKRFSAGFSVKPPVTITRAFAKTTSYDSVTAVSRVSHRVDSLHTAWTTTVSGEDKIRLPWRGTAGISVDVRDDLTVGLEYEMRSYASSLYTDAAGVGSRPWLSFALWHVGVEYRAAEWLTLRGGVRENAEVFEPLSHAIRGEAITYAIYTVGAGCQYAGIRFDLAFEYGDMKYTDTWSNAASINREIRQSVVASVAYALPW